MIRVVLPAHLRTLAQVPREGLRGRRGAGHRTLPCSTRSRPRWPVLKGTIRDHATQQRRPFVRFFAAEDDVSHEPPDAPLPHAVALGTEPFVILGAMAGG